MKVCVVCGNRFDQAGWECPVCSSVPEQVDGYLAFAPDLTETSPGFEAGFFEELASLETKNFWFRSRNRLIIWTLKRYFSQANSLLEIGCGTGYVLSGIEQAFPELTTVGSEIFTRGLWFASQRLSRALLIQIDACQIPFEDEFDVIGAFDVLEHIHQDTVVISEMYRATKMGGGILLTVPQHPWLWSQADDHTHHIRRYRAQELKTKVEQAGFKVVRMTSFVSLLLPVMLLSRSQQREHNSKYDANSELRINGWMNATLESILGMERSLIQLGICLPVGGSLLLIAKKI
ncbi:MAG: class I SAM-dependent methyltransferase [Leptolyngbyaceae cyanobacterium RU_5_1]|nr:class I SAM-dependent methyltransferase [Leptolyngbyaceae cyanobacterium RU_5_1]